MILIVGGLGFIGANLAEALAQLGHPCVLMQRADGDVPPFLKQWPGDRIFVEQADVLDLGALLALGRRHSITGIVDLATGGIAAGATPAELVQDVHNALTGITNVVHAALDWGVARVTFASAPVVYRGAADLPWREDQGLSLSAALPMEAAKKCGEVLSSYLGARTGLECVQARIGSIYGPHYDAARSSLIARLVHAAVHGGQPDLAGMRFGSPHAADGGDQCYVKDAARALALLQTAPALRHRVYNVASGRPTTNQDVVDAIRDLVPGFGVELPPGHAPGGPDTVWHMDIRRLREDTGFEPRFDLAAGLADYIRWLRAGHAR